MEYNNKTELVVIKILRGQEGGKEGETTTRGKVSMRANAVGHDLFLLFINDA